jgi:hypothetical protein
VEAKIFEEKLFILKKISFSNLFENVLSGLAEDTLKNSIILNPNAGAYCLQSSMYIRQYITHRAAFSAAILAKPPSGKFLLKKSSR